MRRLRTVSVWELRRSTQPLEGNASPIQLDLCDTRFFSAENAFGPSWSLNPNLTNFLSSAARMSGAILSISWSRSLLMWPIELIDVGGFSNFRFCRISERRQSLAPTRVKIELKGEQWRCHRPHPGKEAKRYQVEEARELLERVGVKP